MAIRMTKFNLNNEHSNHQIITTTDQFQNSSRLISPNIQLNSKYELQSNKIQFQTILNNDEEK